MPRSGFEPAIPATKLLQTYALDRAATGIGKRSSYPPLLNAVSHITTHFLSSLNFFGFKVIVQCVWEQGADVNI
jgi:hypothetical protein